MAVAMVLVSCKPDPKASQEYKDLKAELDKYRAADSSEAAIRAVYDKLIAINDTNELDQYDALVTADFKFYSTPDRSATDLKTMKEIFKGYYTAIPGMEVTVQQVAITGDVLLARTVLTGVNSGAMGPGMPATGKTVKMDSYDCIRFQDGKMAEYWGLADTELMMQQLGMGAPQGEM